MNHARFKRTCKFTLSVSLWLVFWTGFIGCGGDDDANEWVGTWRALGLSSAEWSVTTNEWEFRGNETFEAELTFKLRADPDIRISLKVSGNYTLLGEDYTMTTQDFDVDFSSEFETALDVDEDDAQSLIGSMLAEPGGGTDTGTWKISGDTLTLFRSDGETSVLQRK